MYGFHAPRTANDLRIVVSPHFAAEHGDHQVSYRLHNGEVRLIRWLTWRDAHTRAKLLRDRGYVVAVSTMGLF